MRVRICSVWFLVVSEAFFLLIILIVCISNSFPGILETLGLIHIQPYLHFHLCLRSLWLPLKHLLILNKVLACFPARMAKFDHEVNFVSDLNICEYFKINKIIINLHYMKCYTPIWQDNWKQVPEVLIPSHHPSPYELPAKHFCHDVSCKPIMHAYLVSFILCFASVLWSARFSLSNWGGKNGMLIKMSLLNI